MSFFLFKQNLISFGDPNFLNFLLWEFILILIKISSIRHWARKACPVIIIAHISPTNPPQITISDNESNTNFSHLIDYLYEVFFVPQLICIPRSLRSILGIQIRKASFCNCKLHDIVLRLCSVEQSWSILKFTKLTVYRPNNDYAISSHTLVYRVLCVCKLLAETKFSQCS